MTKLSITDELTPVALLAAIIDSSDDAIVSKSLDGIILSWNRAAERMFGYSATEAIGQSITLIIPSDRLAEEDYVLGQIRKGSKVDHFETIRQTKDGQLLDISLTVSPIKNERGEVVGASKIARDVTHRKRLELEREELLAREQSARVRLTEAIGARDEFIAVAAHELRSPLHAMVISMHLLRKLCDDPAAMPRVIELIEDLKRELDGFVSLLERLFDVTKIQTGTFELHREPFDLSQLVDQIVGRFSKVHPAISLHVESRIEGIWDRARIDQAISNLLSNAVKYGANKPVAVSATVAGETAVISVRDEGRGISSEDLARIFDQFERVAPRTAADGLGLGLWIARQIAERHGGTISAQSTVGKGSTFTISLPLRTK